MTGAGSLDAVGGAAGDRGGDGTANVTCASAEPGATIGGAGARESSGRRSAGDEEGRQARDGGSRSYQSTEGVPVLAAAIWAAHSAARTPPDSST